MKRWKKYLLTALLMFCLAGSRTALGAEAETTAAAALLGAGVGAGITANLGAGETTAAEETGGESDPEEESAEESAESAGETAEGESGEESGTAEEEEERIRPSDTNTLMLAAASNLQIILDEQLIPQFEEQYPDLRVDVTYGNSELLKTEIEKGSSYDLFFCASKKPMSQLIEEGLIMEDSVHFLMSNELVLFIPRTSRIGIADVYDVSKANSVAIGDPADVPVGEYTIESLKEQELWDTVRSKEVYLGSSVDEVIRWVEDGEVDCGFAYRNDVITHMDKLYIVEGLAPTTFRIGILGSTGRLEAATAFSDFLQTDEVLAQFVAHGFTLPN